MSSAPTPAPAESPVITFCGAALFIGVSERTLRRWVKAGIFPAPLRFGHPARPQLRYLKADIEQFVARAAQGVAHAG